MASIEPTSSAPNQPLVGIAFMLLAALIYSGFDALIKWLVVDFSPFQIIFFRGVFAFLPWLLWVAREPAPARVAAARKPGFQVLRGILGFSAVTCFALAFRVLPLAMAAAVAYSAPLYTIALARPLLGESVRAMHWLVVILGFIGVLTLTHPASGALPVGIAWAVAGSILYALTSLVTRYIGGTDRVPTTMFYSLVVYAILGAVMLPVVWRQPDFGQWIGFAAIGIAGGFAQFFLFTAYRLAPASTVSPFEYTILAWSVIWGLMVWHQLPDTLSAVGMLIIVIANLALVRFEQRRDQLAKRNKSSS